MVESFIDAVEGLATQSKAQMKMKFPEVETAIKSKLTRNLESLNERRYRNQRVFEFEDHCFEDDNEEKDASTQFSQMQKNQLIELQEHLERYCNVLPVFGFNSAKYDINLIKPYLLPILINERNMEPTVIKKANQFVSFKFGDVQHLDIMIFLGGATSLDAFLKAYKTAETKGFFPYEWFDCPQKMNNSEFPTYNAFFSKLRNLNPLEKDYSDYQTLLSSGLKTEEALSKMKLSKPPLSGEENYQYLLDIWNHENMCTFKDFLRWYNNENFVPTLEAMQKMLAFYDKKGIDMLKLGCTLPNLANICLHKSTRAKFYPFTETDKDLLQKIREDMVGGPSIVFTRKAVVDETFIRTSGNICKSFIGIDVGIREESNAEWGFLRTEDCRDDFTANTTTNFFLTTCCTKLMKHDKREPGLFEEEFGCAEMSCLCSKTYCCFDSNSNKYKFSSKGLNKRTLEDCGDGPMAKYRKVLDEFVNVTSTNRGFRTVQHSVATFEQTKKGLSYFYPKRIVDADGIHTRPFSLLTILL